MCTGYTTRKHAGGGGKTLASKGEIKVLYIESSDAWLRVMKQTEMKHTTKRVCEASRACCVFSVYTCIVPSRA